MTDAASTDTPAGKTLERLVDGRLDDLERKEKLYDEQESSIRAMLKRLADFVDLPLRLTPAQWMTYYWDHRQGNPAAASPPPQKNTALRRFARETGKIVRSSFRIIGILLLVAVVIALAYFGWQYRGTFTTSSTSSTSSQMISSSSEEQSLSTVSDGGIPPDQFGPPENDEQAAFLADCAAHSGLVYTADSWNAKGIEPILEPGQLRCNY